MTQGSQEPASPAEIQSGLSPAQRLDYLKQIQTQSDYLVLNLDQTLRHVFEALQQSIYSYQDSLNQGLNKMHGLGQQSEVMFSALINHLAQQLNQEALAYLDNQRLSNQRPELLSLQNPVAPPPATPALEETINPSPRPGLFGDSSLELDGLDDLNVLDLDAVDFDGDEMSLLQDDRFLQEIDAEITQLQLDDNDFIDLDAFTSTPVDSSQPEFIDNLPDSGATIEDTKPEIEPLQVLDQLEAAVPDPLMTVSLPELSPDDISTEASPETEAEQALDELYQSLFGQSLFGQSLFGQNLAGQSLVEKSEGSASGSSEGEFASNLEPDASVSWPEAINPEAVNQEVANFFTVEPDFPLASPVPSPQDITELLDGPIALDSAPELSPELFPEASLESALGAGEGETSEGLDGILLREDRSAEEGVSLADPEPIEAGEGSIDSLFGPGTQTQLAEDLSSVPGLNDVATVTSLADLLPDSLNGSGPDAAWEPSSSSLAGQPEAPNHPGDPNAFMAASPEEDLLSLDDSPRADRYGLNLSPDTLSNLNEDLSSLEAPSLADLTVDLSQAPEAPTLADLTVDLSQPSEPPTPPAISFLENAPGPEPSPL
ncbi:MAG: hypothetical protein HC922_09320, partial [Leptolyngbyaceae cyanobacterium SM2_3_12]|nr:hypothetical protein [Leptolyngbyaceae cyanobacterium SM2_3_12]